MQRPDRVTVPTCIGCGAMSRLGTCGKGCSEEKLELVRAVDCEGLTELASGAHVRAEACRTAARQLGSDRPGPDDWEATYRSVQSAARATPHTIQRSTGTAQLGMSRPRARRHGGVLGAAASTPPSPVWESASGVPSTGSTPTCTGRSAYARLPSATWKCVCAGCCTASRRSHPARANGSAVAGCYRPRRYRRLTFARTRPLRDDPRIRTQSVVD